MTDGFIEKSFSPVKEDLEKINQYTRRAFKQEELYLFSITLCDNDVDRDYEAFSLSALKELAELFRGKTGIFDHSMKSGDQMARIYDTWVEEQPGKQTANGEALWNLKAKAYMVKSEKNVALITDIDAGIKKEVSVSCSMKNAICSVCGKDKRKIGCEHISGRAYKGQAAFTELSGACDAYEWSFVAVPAQRKAGVTKAYSGGKDEINMNDIMKELKNCDGSITFTKAQAGSLLSMVDTLSDEAKIGKEYKDNLVKDVISMCAVKMPEMNLKLFEGVANVMTVKELKGFKDAFGKMQIASFSGAPQLAAPKQTKKQSNNQFVI